MERHLLDSRKSLRHLSLCRRTSFGAALRDGVIKCSKRPAGRIEIKPSLLDATHGPYTPTRGSLELTRPRQAETLEEEREPTTETHAAVSRRPPKPSASFTMFSAALSWLLVLSPLVPSQVPEDRAAELQRALHRVDSARQLLRLVPTPTQEQLDSLDAALKQLAAHPDPAASAAIAKCYVVRHAASSVTQALLLNDTDESFRAVSNRLSAFKVLTTVEAENILRAAVNKSRSLDASSVALVVSDATRSASVRAAIEYVSRHVSPSLVSEMAKALSTAEPGAGLSGMGQGRCRRAVRAVSRVGVSSTVGRNGHGGTNTWHHGASCPRWTSGYRR